MKERKKEYSNEFKVKVSIAALKGDKTIAALCREFGLHETQINRWKKILKEGAPQLFEKKHEKANYKEIELQLRVQDLNEYIGELSVENKFLKKNLNL